MSELAPVDVLGEPLGSPRLMTVVQRYALRFDGISTSGQYHLNPTSGLAIEYRDGIADALFLFGNLKDGYSDFQGRLPLQLGFEMHRGDVIGLLGAPVASGVGPEGDPWDRYHDADRGLEVTACYSVPGLLNMLIVKRLVAV